MLSIIGQARAGIQSPALYNFVTVQSFTLFFLKCVYVWYCKKNAIFAYNFSVHKCMDREILIGFPYELIFKNSCMLCM